MSIQDIMQLVFTPEEIEKINQASDTIENIVRPRLAQLSPDDRKTMLKMGNRMSGFVGKTFDYAVRYTQYVPSYIKLEDSLRNYDVVKALSGYYEIMNSTKEMLADTILIAGSKAYQDALAIYDAVKAAAKNRQPGAQLIADELKAWFQKGSSDVPQNEPVKA